MRRGAAPTPLTDEGGRRASDGAPRLVPEPGRGEGPMGLYAALWFLLILVGRVDATAVGLRGPRRGRPSRGGFPR
ncbi:hypothetical protein ACFPM0_02645 [Pseudonocardia sulfidoxydans]|uniref:hypothetical protein n=1 Tax=Pseudonocardia sulfidoxydans TaxID=54011 RepID=UPI0036160ED2